MSKKKTAIVIATTAVIAMGVGGFYYFSQAQGKPLMGITLGKEKKEEKLKEVEPVVIKEDILLYVETDKAKHFGDLYIKKLNNEKEKIASDVKANNYVQLYQRQGALFLDKDNNLYLYEKGKDKEKVATNVVEGSFKASENEKAITYIKSDDINTHC